MMLLRHPLPRHFANRLLLLLLWAAALAGCEKIVSVDLNKTDPQIVIDAIVCDSAATSARISTTESYFEPSLLFPLVTDARVTVTDDEGRTDSLRFRNGAYVSSSPSASGLSGHTFSLTVSAGGKTYRARSTMPTKVRIDSMYTVLLNTPGGRRGYDLYIVFNDPPGEENYYRIDATNRNTSVLDSINTRRYRVYNDRLTNGTRTTYRVGLGRRVQPGDSVSVEFYTIDKGTYAYYRTVNDALATSRSPTALSPANPLTNLSGGALGYFSAYVIDRRLCIIP
jgi:hypothetical protein